MADIHVDSSHAFIASGLTSLLRLDMHGPMQRMWRWRKRPLVAAPRFVLCQCDQFGVAILHTVVVRDAEVSDCSEIETVLVRVTCYSGNCICLCHRTSAHKGQHRRMSSQNSNVLKPVDSSTIDGPCSVNTETNGRRSRLRTHRSQQSSLNAMICSRRNRPLAPNSRTKRQSSTTPRNDDFNQHALENIQFLFTSRPLMVL